MIISSFNVNEVCTAETSSWSLMVQFKTQEYVFPIITAFEVLEPLAPSVAVVWLLSWAPPGFKSWQQRTDEKSDIIVLCLYSRQRRLTVMRKDFNLLLDVSQIKPVNACRNWEECPTRSKSYLLTLYPPLEKHGTQSSPSLWPITRLSGPVGYTHTICEKVVLVFPRKTKLI